VRLRIRCLAWLTLLLRSASRRWGFDLRAPQRGPARSCRNKPRVFSKQRVRQRNLSFDCLGSRRLTTVRRVKLSNPRDVPAAFEIGRQPDADDVEGEILRHHTLA